MGPHSRLTAAFIGEGTLLVQAAEIFSAAGHQIVAMVSREPRVRSWAGGRAIPLESPEGPWRDLLRAHSFDYLFSVANMMVLPDDVLSLPRSMAINFHDGPLPRYAGAHATSWTLLNGESRHAITWHEMTPRVDAGRILRQQPVEIAPDETAFSLNAKCYEAGVQAFAALVDDLAAGTLVAQEQRAEDRSYFGLYRRPPAACLIDWEQPAEAIGRFVRALDFGRYRNPLGLPKIAVDGDVLVVANAVVSDRSSGVVPGTVLSVGGNGLVVATLDRDVRIQVLTAEGQSLTPQDLAQRNLTAGCRLTRPSTADLDRLTRVHQAICRHEDDWASRLETLNPLELPYVDRSATHRQAAPGTLEHRLPEQRLRQVAEMTGATSRDLVVAALAVHFGRLSGASEFDLGLGEAALSTELGDLAACFASRVPLRIRLDQRWRISEAVRSVRGELAETRTWKTYCRDLIARDPRLSRFRSGGEPIAYPVSIVVDAAPASMPDVGSALTIYVAPEGRSIHWVYDPQALSRDAVEAMRRQFELVLWSLETEPDRSIGELSLLAPEERQQVLVDWNATGIDYSAACIHELFEQQAARTPDAVALISGECQFTYRELSARGNQAAHALRRAGVGAGSLVGLCAERSPQLLVGLLGILKAGAAYVPLDPAYPTERLRLMVEDAELSALMAEHALAVQLPVADVPVVWLDADMQAFANESEASPGGTATVDDLAYVIYTSGSTGRPKGVMLTHRNAANFFVGMDAHLHHDPPGVWLAVTSLSFDISVLELLWTLCRGFTVVLHADDHRRLSSTKTPGALAQKPIDMSLFYFASGGDDAPTGQYRLLLEGAKFADRHGFSAVWTPERHLHEFGGLYPNPAVAGAAIAAITERVRIRAGSCVLPLHHPIRVAEEWALVDNLSEGRVGVSFASGWQPNDFVLSPAAFAQRHSLMQSGIETVRKLWRGEAVEFPGPNGPVSVRTLPRPIQPELPIWITAAGNPETFRMAGALGAGVLTHLLGQTLEELAEKLRVYRRAWREAGHGPGSGHVTLMLHTFVGDDLDAVRAVVREPMKQYLRSSVDLIKKAAWTFPTFARLPARAEATPDELFDSGELGDEAMEALLDHAFERYFETSGLFGTPESCVETINRLKALDVDEVACLIDFGVAPEVVLEHLQHLSRLKELCTPSESDEQETPATIPELVVRHNVTHLQCTPSMARMILMDEQGAEAFRPLRQLLIGGEAFPPDLAGSLLGLVSGSILNMYGPTETTIWSTVDRVGDVGASVPIGRPIANTDVYVLDQALQPVPIGVPGELFIGGHGVASGYLRRPELTAERFIRHPFRRDPEARLYRTGDQVRYRADGRLEYLGRLDQQIKLRGHRIELHEVEAALYEHPAVREAVVILREDMPGDVRLVGYVVPDTRDILPFAEIMDHLRARLPEIMVPAHLVVLDAFPLTPNAKVDRKALPAPSTERDGSGLPAVSPRNDLERTVAVAWEEVLGIGGVSIHANFFELGGHSLSATQVVTRLCRSLGVNLTLRTFFKYPTIAEIAAHIADSRAQVEHRPVPTIARVSRDAHRMRVAALTGASNDRRTSH